MLFCPALLALAIAGAERGSWGMAVVLAIIALALAFNAFREIREWLERV
jgi:hypothetical protein